MEGEKISVVEFMNGRLPKIADSVVDGENQTIAIFPITTTICFSQNIRLDNLGTPFAMICLKTLTFKGVYPQFCRGLDVE